MASEWGEFLAPKALSSNQLGNSLRINIVETSEKAAYSRLGDLHIWGSLTFRLGVVLHNTGVVAGDAGGGARATLTVFADL
jgi:hypothetical protein